MPGMTAMLKVRKNGKAAGDLGFWVPSAAVMEDSSGLKCVWVVDSSMKVVKRAVGVAGLSGENIFITNGLSTGERIATAGTARLAEGMKVKELKSIDGRKIPVQSGNGK